MRVALIGAGRVGEVHAAILAHLVDRLVVHDEDQQPAHGLAGKVGAIVVADPLEALAAVDAAVIATPPAAHASLVKAAAELSRPVLCEKPLAETAADAAELAEYLAERGVLVEVGFQRRFDAGYSVVRDAVRRGDVGRLHLLRLLSTETGLAPSPKTNIFRNTAIHDFDLVRWLSGEEVVSVYVQGADRSGDPFDRSLDPDTIVATMRLTGGALAVATVSRLSPLGYDVRAEVLGSRDHLCTGLGPSTPVHFVDGFTRAESEDHTWGSWRTRFAQAFHRELTAFLAAVGGEDPRGATPTDAVQAQRIAEAARLSMEQDAPVHLDPWP